jgi:hypothetical protein
MDKDLPIKNPRKNPGKESGLARTKAVQRRQAGGAGGSPALARGVWGEDGGSLWDELLQEGPLREEIDILRRALRRVSDEIDDDTPLQELIKLLDALGKGGTRLSTLLKANKDLGGSFDLMELVRGSMGVVLEECRSAGVSECESDPLSGVQSTRRVSE